MVAKKAEIEISVMQVSRGHVQFKVLGDSPLICNAMSAKVREQLLLPPAKKNAASKAATLKHDPMAEYRRSVYTSRDEESDALIVVKATAFKGAMRSAAIDLPGSNKAQIGRLAYVVGDEVQIFGVPKIMCSVTRSADINKTPDVRTRAIIENWAATIDVEFTEPILKQEAIVNLMAAAGITQGVGDWRVQKGSGNFGRFSLVGADDPAFLDIVNVGGRAAQELALLDPVAYDSETEELLSWFEVEAKRRGFTATT